MTTKKKKTFVLTVSKKFMAKHVKAGERTGFKDLIKEGVKIHTIREGTYWEDVVRQVNAGYAILSVREWIGIPYASKQVEICQFDKLGWQDVAMYNTPTDDGTKDCVMFIDAKKITDKSIREKVAANDGLKYPDFVNWFNLGLNVFKGGIIHFTDFRY